MHSWGFALREGVFAENKEGIDQGKKLIFRSPFPILVEGDIRCSIQLYKKRTLEATVLLEL